MPLYSVEESLEYWTKTAPKSWNHDGGLLVDPSKLLIGTALYSYEIPAE